MYRPKPVHQRLTAHPAHVVRDVRADHLGERANDDDQEERRVLAGASDHRRRRSRRRAGNVSSEEIGMHMASSTPKRTMA